MRRGIIPSGGGSSVSRLNSGTNVVSKELLPVYHKPMIYCLLTTLMLAGLKDCQLISKSLDTHRFQRLLGDGSQWGISIQYVVQPSPNGLSQAFIFGGRFVGNNAIALILGDNLFYGPMFREQLHRAAEVGGGENEGATVSGSAVNDPVQYGVVAFNAENRAVSIEEKPNKPKSRCAVNDLYLYDHQVYGIAPALKPSSRRRLKITDFNRIYLEIGQLNVEIMGRGMAWFDTGTRDYFSEATQYIQVLENPKDWGLRAQTRSPGGWVG
jgi:glucose-1-phosphate thymidylyltransferase